MYVLVYVCMHVRMMCPSVWLSLCLSVTLSLSLSVRGYIRIVSFNGPDVVKPLRGALHDAVRPDVVVAHSER